MRSLLLGVVHAWVSGGSVAADGEVEALGVGRHE